MSYQITFSNPWVLRVDGARRRVASYVAAPMAVAALLISMTGGVWLYGAGGALALAPAYDRALQYVCIEGPLYLVALAVLAYERRARVSANIGPAGAVLGGGVLGFAGFGLAVAVAGLIGALGPGSGAPAPLDHRLFGLGVGALLIAFQAYGEELFFRGWLQPILATRWGPGIGIGVTSLLFAAAHALGRPIGAVALFNDALAGLLFGLIAFRSGGLLAPFAAHFAWNWAEQSVLGLTPNPGVDPLGSLFDFDLIGSPLISGGADELNGTLGAALALLVAIGLTLAWRPGRAA